MKRGNRMKLTKLIALSFVTCSGVVVVSPVVQAAGDGGKVTSSGIIGFVANTDIVTPVDPLDPENPILPVDPENPGTAGPLSIDYVSTIRFGESNKTSGKHEVYWAELDKFTDSKGNATTRPNYIQVTDSRGSNAGWHLTVTQEAQFMNQTNELEGAELTFANGVLNTADDGATPEIKTPLTLSPGVATDVLNAKANEGTGTWAAVFGKDNTEGEKSVSLSVPGKTKKVEGKYTTALTWDLTDAPA